MFDFIFILALSLIYITNIIFNCQINIVYRICLAHSMKKLFDIQSTKLLVSSRYVPQIFVVVFHCIVLNWSGYLLFSPFFRFVLDQNLLFPLPVVVNLVFHILLVLLVDYRLYIYCYFFSVLTYSVRSL